MQSEGDLCVNAKKIIMSAFYELLRRQPIHTISVSRIIQEAEVSKPTFYRHFYNKYDLLAQVFEDLFAPILQVGLSLTWREALVQVFENLDRERAVFRNGFKTEDQFYLRNSVMQKVLEDDVITLLRGKGADTEDTQLMFSVRACVIGHVAAMCGWAVDSRRQSAEQIADLLIGTLPPQLAACLIG